MKHILRNIERASNRMVSSFIIIGILATGIFYVTGLNTSIEKIDIKLDSSIERLDTKLDSSVARLEASIAATNASISEIKASIARLEAIIIEMQNDITQIRANANITDLHTTQIVNLTEEIKQIRADIANQ